MSRALPRPTQNSPIELVQLGDFTKYEVLIVECVMLLERSQCQSSKRVLANAVDEFKASYCMAVYFFVLSIMDANEEISGSWLWRLSVPSGITLCLSLPLVWLRIWNTEKARQWILRSSTYFLVSLQESQSPPRSGRLTQFMAPAVQYETFILRGENPWALGDTFRW